MPSSPPSYWVSVVQKFAVPHAVFLEMHLERTNDCRGRFIKITAFNNLLQKNTVCQVFDKIHGPRVNTEVQLSERFIQYIALSVSTEDYEELLY